MMQDNQHHVLYSNEHIIKKKFYFNKEDIGFFVFLSYTERKVLFLGKDQKLFVAKSTQKLLYNDFGLL